MGFKIDLEEPGYLLLPSIFYERYVIRMVVVGLIVGTVVKNH